MFKNSKTDQEYNIPNAQSVEIGFKITSLVFNKA